MDDKELINLKSQIFKIRDEKHFLDMALQVFKFQYENLEVYRQYCDLIHCRKQLVFDYKDIPFLPIDFFRSYRIFISDKKADLIFSSSGTTGSQTSHHEIADIELYRKSLTKGFEYFYGNIKDYCLLALLPSYLERSGSSLVYMAKTLINLTEHPDSGFYLNDLERLSETLKRLRRTHQKTILIGVTYALMDLAKLYPLDFPDLIIMETGGMKGKKKEMVREEVHQILKKAFHCLSIHSEYGMTELLSQAYSKDRGIFYPVPWMKVLIRNMDDPLSLAPHGQTGGINVIDLANLYSCSFIAVQDIGKLYSNGGFEVMGRYDKSLVRGCNLMVY